MFSRWAATIRVVSLAVMVPVIVVVLANLTGLRGRPPAIRRRVKDNNLAGFMTTERPARVNTGNWAKAYACTEQ